MKIAGIVLAGGLSSRMGTNKALLSLQGNTLLTRTEALLQRLDLDKVCISGEYADFHCIADEFPQLGPIGGIYSCAKALIDDFDYMLVLPVDMPFITAAELSPLLQLTENNVSGAFHENATFPMLIQLNQKLINYLYHCLVETTEKKGRSLYRMVRTLDFTTLVESEITSFDNTNTPDEWRQCLTRFEK